MSNARKLITHKTAGPVVEFAYNDYANAKQRLAFAQQFYGPSFMLLSSGEVQPLAKVGVLPIIRSLVCYYWYWYTYTLFDNLKLL